MNWINFLNDVVDKELTQSRYEISQIRHNFVILALVFVPSILIGSALQYAGLKRDFVVIVAIGTFVGTFVWIAFRYFRGLGAFSTKRSDKMAKFLRRKDG